MARMKWTNTNDAFSSVGGIIVRGLRQELIDQKHNASGRLSRGLKKSKMFNIKNGKGVNVMSNVAYWKAVNNPKFAKKPNLNAIASWVQNKGLPLSAIAPIFRKLNNKGYGKPYVYWTEGNNLRRTDFAGHTARKHKNKVVAVVGKGLVKDVVSMVKATIKENVGTKNVRFTK
tara:strand:+ start:977 stop:1495 length:519 start_codon:yes stop_codon:yes gene_type:complete